MKRALLTIITVILLVLPAVVWGIDSLPPRSGLVLYQFSQLFALVGFTLLVLQFVLTSRVPLIEKGIGQDRLFRRHRSFGVWGFCLVAAHGVFYTTWELISTGSISTNIPKLMGVVGLTVFAIISAVALWHKQLGMKYETWKNIHRLTFIILPSVFIHSLLLGSTLSGSRIGPTLLRIQWWILIGLYGLVVLYRIMALIAIRRNPYTVSSVTQETHDTWTLAFSGKPLSFIPGQFMFVNLVRDGKTSPSHPFTISSSPAAGEVTITPKAIGDFTATVGDTKPGDRAYIEAPFGVFSYLNSNWSKLAFVAGGIGITPFMSMLRHMQDTGAQREVVLIWGNKTEEDIAFNDELKKLQEELDSFRIHHVLSGGEWTGKSGFSGDTGFVDAEKVKSYLGDPADYEFYICGPPVMMEKVVPAVKSLGVPSDQIRFERFAL